MTHPTIDADPAGSKEAQGSGSERISAREVSGAVLRVQGFDSQRERTMAGWLRIAFFSSILFNHTIDVPLEFLEERVWVSWAHLVRDFGAIGFFLLAGTTLRGRSERGEPLVLPPNLLKLALAAAVLATFDFMITLLKGAEPGSFRLHFYRALYDTNLWFFVAYALAAPLLLTMDRRGVSWTAVCCLGFVLFPASTPLISPFILQSVSLAFVCMAIGRELHGIRVDSRVMLIVAVLALVMRAWLDDLGTWRGVTPVPAFDPLMRIVYSVACFLLLKNLADMICRYASPPRWTAYLFIPYVVQFPLVIIVKVAVTAVFIGSLDVRMPPIFLSFGETMLFMLVNFAICLACSFILAALLCRFRIRA